MKVKKEKLKVKNDSSHFSLFTYNFSLIMNLAGLGYEF